MKRCFIPICLLFVGFLLVSGYTLAQKSDAASVRLCGSLSQPFGLTVDASKQLELREVEVSGKDGETTRYMRVNLSDVLQKEGATPLAEALRGENLAKYLRARARDGYRLVFSFAEIDPALTDQVVLLAFLSNGQPLGLGVGLFRRVVPQDKRQVRWVQGVTEIEGKKRSNET